ncbi:MAG: hypothetical protein F4059_01720 [Gemmatimonadetes bacterium]|nr:hypothetical protein [Gemmatimonadota bacterium]
MSTMDERYDKGWALLREDMAKRETEAAKRDAEAARREVQRTEREATARWWQTAIATAVILAGIGVAATVIINYLPG